MPWGFPPGRRQDTLMVLNRDHRVAQNPRSAYVRRDSNVHQGNMHMKSYYGGRDIQRVPQGGMSEEERIQWRRERNRLRVRAHRARKRAAREQEERESLMAMQQVAETAGIVLEKREK